MPSAGVLLVIVMASVLGAAYWVYGKRVGRMGFMLSGAALCFYPYFVSGLWVVVLVGLGLAAVPFVLDF